MQILVVEDEKRIEELRAVSRRGAIPPPVCLAAADVILDPATRRVTRGSDELSLTPREFTLLEPSCGCCGAKSIRANRG